jgi:ribosomal protein S18 acetylase RimI-like enzyme
MSSIEPALATDGPSTLHIADAISVFTRIDRACVAELWDSYLDEGEAASGYAFRVYRNNGGRVLGFACFGPHPLTEGTFDLYWIAVDPAARRQGVGRALLAQVEAEVRGQGGRLLVIETSSLPSYAPTRRFYESCGCRCEAVIRDFYAPGDDLVIFVMELVPRSGSLATSSTP